MKSWATILDNIDKIFVPLWIHCVIYWQSKSQAVLFFIIVCPFLKALFLQNLSIFNQITINKVECKRIELQFLFEMIFCAFMNSLYNLRTI